MSKAIVDPEELRRFAQELKRFNDDLQNSVSSLQARFGSLSDTWQDEEHASGGGGSEASIPQTTVFRFRALRSGSVENLTGLSRFVVDGKLGAGTG